MGPCPSSSDLRSLFTHQAEWNAVATTMIDVYQFPSQQLITPGHDPALKGNNMTMLENVGALAKLDAAGIEIAVELGSLKEWDCTATHNAVKQAAEIVGNVRRLLKNSSHVANSPGPMWLCMDEPLHSSGSFPPPPWVHGEPPTCKLGNVTLAASRVAAWMRIVAAELNFTGKFLDTEPYPYFTPPQLCAWMGALRRATAARGQPRISTFRLDIDFNAALLNSTVADVVRDVAAIKKCSDTFGLGFSAIVNGFPVTTDAQYAGLTRAHLGYYARAVANAAQLVFQSWNVNSNLPTNLPESDANTMTGIIEKACG